MKELATQSASDNVDAPSRDLIQAEFSELQEEITRIVDTTKFQGSHLLKTVDAVTAAAGSTHTADGLADGASANDATATATGTYTGTADTVSIRYTDAGTGFEISNNGTDDVAINDGRYGGRHHLTLSMTVPPPRWQPTTPSGPSM